MGVAKIYKIYTSCWLEKKEEREMKRKRMGGETKKKEQDRTYVFLILSLLTISKGMYYISLQIIYSMQCLHLSKLTATFIPVIKKLRANP